MSKKLRHDSGCVSFILNSGSTTGLTVLASMMKQNKQQVRILFVAKRSSWHVIVILDRRASSIWSWNLAGSWQLVVELGRARLWPDFFCSPLSTGKPNISLFMSSLITLLLSLVREITNAELALVPLQQVLVKTTSRETALKVPQVQQTNRYGLCQNG